MDRLFLTFLDDLGLREGQGVVLGGDLLYGTSVQNLWLKEHTGVRVPDTAQQEAFGLVGASRDNNLWVKKIHKYLIGALCDKNLFVYRVNVSTLIKDL